MWIKCPKNNLKFIILCKKFNICFFFKCILEIENKIGGLKERCDQKLLERSHHHKILNFKGFY